MKLSQSIPILSGIADIQDKNHEGRSLNRSSNNGKTLNL
jgi:hypothetical protein